MKNISKISLIVCLIMIMGVGSVSAMLEVSKPIDIGKGDKYIFDGKEISYNNIWDTYKPISVRTNWDLPLISSTKLDAYIEQHDFICGIDCSSTMILKTYNRGVLIDDIKFFTIDGEKKTEQEIRNYQFYIKTGETEKEVNDYEQVCIKTGKYNFYENEIENCENKIIGTHIEVIPIWTTYTIGTEVDAGVYEIKLEGKKLATKEVDWIIKTQGVNLESWAVWGATNLNNNLIHYWKLDDGNSLVVKDEKLLANGTKLAGAPMNQSGIINSAYNFTNSSGIINYSNAYVRQLNRSFAVNFWVYGRGADTAIETTYPAYISSGAYGNNGWAISNGGESNGIKLGTWGSELGCNAHIVLNRWNMATLVMLANNTEQIYIDGVLNCSAVVTANIGTSALANGQLGSIVSNEQTNSSIDEVGIWNRTLLASEITDLYNGGAGLPYGEGGVTLNSPADSYISPTNLINFNCSAQLADPLINISLWHNASGVFSLNDTSAVTGTLNTSILNSTFIDSQNTILWSCQACSSVECKFANENRTLTKPIVYVVSQTYNTSTYETSTETFSTNATEATSANLIYAGTSYTATQSGTVWSRTIQIPTISALVNNTFYWNFQSGINTTTYNQSVAFANFSICGGVGGLTPFLNFTFKDESTSAVLNASNDLTSLNYWLGDGTVYKSYTFQNTTVNYQYTFCATPNKTFTGDMTFKYSGTIYPLRTFTYDNQAFTNATTQKTLYMLSSTEGIYSAIRAAEASGAGISGVLIQYEREISGVWTLLGQEVTGDDGVATLWVNPNYVYRFTASKTGYTTAQVSLQPSQTQYTIVMASSAGGGNYTSQLNGLRWTAYPSSGGLVAQANQVFNATVTAYYLDLENCKLELLNSSNISQILDSVTSITNSSYCNPSLTYDTVKNQNLFGRLSVDTTSTDGFVIVDADWKWIVIDYYNGTSVYRISNFFSELRDLNEWGVGNEAEFSRIVMFFLITTIFIGIFIYFSGVEISNPGLSAIIIWAIVLFASLGGFLTFESGSSTLAGPIKQYGFFFIYSLLISGYILSMIRRTGD